MISSLYLGFCMMFFIFLEPKKKVFLLLGLQMSYLLVLIYSSWWLDTAEMTPSSYGFMLVLMSIWLGVTALVVKSPAVGKGIFSGLTLLIIFSVCVAFSSKELFVFFLFFEFTFFPVMVMIWGWGYNRERLSSVVYLVLFSMFGSMFHLLALSLLIKSAGGLSMTQLNCFVSGVSDEGSSMIWWNMLILLFCIKSPLFCSHSWLTKAHVEAPTSASMMLAGILLKLGVYGFILVSLVFQPYFSYLLWIQAMGVFGGVMAALISIRTQNFKLMIALSSVSHMSFSLAVLFCLSDVSIEVVLLNSVAHGLCSSGMFFWVGTQYLKSSSQNVMMGLSDRSTSIYSCFGLLMILSFNCGIPPFMSFWFELLGMNLVFLKWSGMWIFLVLFSLCVMAFSLFIGLNFFSGGCSQSVFSFSWSYLEELGLFMHYFPGVMLFVFCNLLYV